jgi:hypothetical protein
MRNSVGERKTKQKEKGLIRERISEESAKPSRKKRRKEYKNERMRLGDVIWTATNKKELSSAITVIARSSLNHHFANLALPV